MRTSQMPGKRQIPAVQGVFTWPSAEPHFIVNRCKKCGTVSFPKSPVCRNPKCKDKGEVEEALLARRGKLLSYTLVCYPPPPPFVSPQPFVPFPIGEVQFPEGIAIKVAHQAIALGKCDIALAVGFDCSPEGFFQGTLGTINFWTDVEK